MIKSSVDEYRKFLMDYMPKTSFLNYGNTKMVYARVTENVLVTEIFKNQINDKQTDCYLEFLEEYKNQFNKSLLYIGINDYSSLEYCVRRTIENLLKFIYSIYIIEPLEYILGLSFRHLKEDLIEFSNSGLQMDIKSIIKLCDIYGRFSNGIHGKNNPKISIEYVMDIIEVEDNRLKEIDNTLLNILNIYEEIIGSILEIEFLSTSELFMLKRNLSNNRFFKVKDKILRK